jgi:ClpP class serine protease
VRATEAAIYRGELAIRAGLADRIGTLDAAIAAMAAELDRPASTSSIPVNPMPKRSPSMASESKEIQIKRSEKPQAADVQPIAAEAEPLVILEHVQGKPKLSAEDKLRADFAEIISIASQAARLGVSIDAAEAVAKSISPDALRRSVLEELSRRAEASSVIAIARSNDTNVESPIVRRARSIAAAAARN